MPRIKTRTKQFPLRLTEEMHTKLMQVAAHEDISAQQLLEDAISREIARLEAKRTRRADLSEHELLAYRFMLAAPTPMVIKNDSAAIVWANLRYQNIVEKPLEQLRHKTLAELGLLLWERTEVEKDIADTLARETEDGSWCLEPIIIDGRKLLFGTSRFVFRAAATHKFLGDVSFEWADVMPGRRQVSSGLLAQLKQAQIPPGVEKLFAPFLDRCPSAIAIKDAAARICFCNATYARLAGVRQSPHRILNRTTQDLFQLGDAHPLLADEADIMRANCWMFTNYSVGKFASRVCLRFPIPGDDGLPTHVGEISTTIGTDEHPLTFQRRSQQEKSSARAVKAARRR